jgi:hypothetical protein
MLILLSSAGRRLLARGRLVQKVLSNGEIWIVLRRKINFDRDGNAAAIKQLAATDCYIPIDSSV